MKHIAYLVVLVLLTFSCKEKWDEHYGDGQKSKDVVSPLNVLDYLKSKSEYSKFVEALEKTGVDQQLMRNQDLTVWAINNENMTELEGTSDTSRMEYHINNLVFGKEKLEDGLRMRSLNGKYIMVATSGDDLSVAGSIILKTNMYCQNGVIHEIETPMQSVISIYEYLLSLGDEYSTIVDTIFNTNDTIFDIANSTPLGIDETGNTIYDSVFIIGNKLFEGIDFSSEFVQATMFLPNNDVVDNCLQTFGEQLIAIGREYTMEDTVMAMSWIKEAIFFDHIISDYYADQDLFSAFDKVWRTTVQQVNPERKFMSNGLVYEVTKMKIPNNVFIDRIKSLVHYYEFTDSVLRPQIIEFFNLPEPAFRYYAVKDLGQGDFTTDGFGVVHYICLEMNGDLTDDAPIAVEFSPLRVKTVNNITSASEMLIPAGEYKLYMGFRALNHAYLNVYFNGELVANEKKVDDSSPWNFDRVTDTYPGTKYDGLGGLVNIVNVPGEGLQHVKIKVEFNRLGSGTREQIQIYHWALVPTENNY